MSRLEYNDGYATGMMDLVELQPAMLEAVVRGYFGISMELLHNRITIQPNLPTEWIEAGKPLGITTPDLSYNYTKKDNTLTVAVTTTHARLIRVLLPVHSSVHDVTVDESAVPVVLLPELQVGAARVVAETASAKKSAVFVVELGDDATVSGDLTVVEGKVSEFRLSGAGASSTAIIGIRDPQGVLEGPPFLKPSDRVEIKPLKRQHALNDMLMQPLFRTVFLELQSNSSTTSSANQRLHTSATWLHALDLSVVPIWELETIVAAANSDDSPLPCPDHLPPPCVILPRIENFHESEPVQKPGLAYMVDCVDQLALNFSAEAVVAGEAGKIQVSGTSFCLTPAPSANHLELGACASAQEWYFRSGMGTKEGGHLCLASSENRCLDRAHHANDDTTLDTYEYVPTAKEKFHDENWHIPTAGIGHLHSGCVEPSCAKAQCIGGVVPGRPPPTPPRPAAKNGTLLFRLRNAGNALISGTAEVAVKSISLRTSLTVLMQPGSSQLFSVVINSTSMKRIAPGSTRMSVTLGGLTQHADAVSWGGGTSDSFASKRMRMLDLSSAFNFDAEKLYSAKSMAARWRLDYTGAGVGIDAQIRYNNSARIYAQRPGHPISLDNTLPYKGLYLDAPPIVNLGYGNLPEQMCQSGVGSSHCNNLPNKDTALVPNGTVEGDGCNVWHSYGSSAWTLPAFKSWSDFGSILQTSLNFHTGSKGSKNILALIASQPYDAFSSAVTLAVPRPYARFEKLYLLTANLQKSLKCYTPHAEVRFIYSDGNFDRVSLTPPWSFSSLGGNAGYQAFVPAHHGIPFGSLTGTLGSSTAVVAVMDVLVPDSSKLLAKIELKTVVTEAIFGVMGATLLLA
eukprot:SAG31_NODE_216_length_20053_cov_9.223815_4_plen_853_part_00